MEIKWKNVFLAIAIIYLLVHLPTILNTGAAILSDTVEMIKNSLGQPFGPSYVRDSNTFTLAKLCVLLIFVVGVLKLIKNWNRK